jgi:hypothetical protein
MDKNTKKTMQLHPHWEELAKLATKTGWGKITITLKDGIPTDIDPIVPHIKLGSAQVDEALEQFKAISPE